MRAGRTSGAPAVVLPTCRIVHGGHCARHSFLPDPLGWRRASLSESSVGDETEQLGHDPFVGVLLDVVAGVVELRHGRVGQSLAPVLENPRA